MINVTRRAFLALAACLPWAARVDARAPQTATSAAPTISREDFLKLSQRLVGRTALDPKVAETYRIALLANAANGPILASLVTGRGPATPEQAALERTVIEWWYTGIYTIHGETRVATDTAALQWSAIGVSAPSVCGGPFGAWSRPPRGIS
jgi:hypothetical protein